MSHTKHTCYRTQSRVTFAGIARFVLPAFPGAVLLAFTFYPAEVFPWLARILEALK